MNKEKIKEIAELINEEIGGIMGKKELLKALVEILDYLDESIVEYYINYDNNGNLVIDRVLIMAIEYYISNLEEW